MITVNPFAVIQGLRGSKTKRWAGTGALGECTHLVNVCRVTRWFIMFLNDEFVFDFAAELLLRLKVKAGVQAD